MADLIYGGRRQGRTAAAIVSIVAEAENAHEAALAVADLRERGVAMLKDGKRYLPPPARPPRIVFDEAPCLSSVDEWPFPEDPPDPL